MIAVTVVAKAMTTAKAVAGLAKAVEEAVED
jgi:hypothetical protein